MTTAWFVSAIASPSSRWLVFCVAEGLVSYTPFYMRVFWKLWELMHARRILTATVIPIKKPPTSPTAYQNP